MTIEFRCISCKKLLRVPDDAAGKQSRCPACEAVQEVPTARAPLDETAQHPSQAVPPPPQPPGGFADTAAEESPHRAPQAGDTAGTPELEGITSGQLDVGDVISTAWKIMTVYYLPILGAYLLMMVVGAVVGLILVALPVAGIALLVGSNPGADPEIAVVLVIIGLVVLMMIAVLLAASWVNAGILLFQLKLVREEIADFSELFQGTRYVLPMFAAMVIFTLAFYLGILFCIVPGVYLLIIWSQFAFLIIDRDVGPIDALRRSAELTQGNRLNILLIWLIIMGIALVGGVIPFIGGCISLLLQPFIAMVFVVTYLRLSGQPIVLPAK